MNLSLQDYDFPISHGHYRALCAMHGKPVPPNIDVLPYTMTPEQHRQQFIDWQCQQQEMMFGYSSKENVTRERTKSNRLTPYPTNFSNTNSNIIYAPRRFKDYE